MEIPEPDQALLRRWGIADRVQPMPGGWCSRVYGTDECVMKVPVMGEEVTHGWRASLALSGRTGLEVLDHDPETGALLMRRIRPGTALAESGMSFADMREIFVEMFLSISDIPDEGWVTMAQYYAEEPAQRPSAEALDASAPSRRFLHADLHHGNILDNQGS